MVYQKSNILKFNRENYEEIEDNVINEFPLTIYLNNQEIVTLLCIPQYLEDLALGFLLSEGLLKDKEKIEIDYEKGIAYVEGKESNIIKHTFLKRYITTGCGKGTSFYHFNDSKQKKIDNNVYITSQSITSLMKEVQLRSEIYKITGCVHIAALCTGKKMLVFREDIGRHNAVDKIVGYCFENKINMEDKILVTSGRLSSEIIIKTAKMGIPVLVSRSAPSSLAIKIADETNLTLVGFARGKRMNVYTNFEKVK